MVRIVLSTLLLCAMLASTSVPSIAQTKAPAGGAKAAASTAIVNVNSATAAEFEALPGVGAKLAARIVEYRTKNGPFKKLEDLMNVRGLGEKNFLKLKAQLTLGSPKSGERAQQ